MPRPVGHVLGERQGGATGTQGQIAVGGSPTTKFRILGNGCAWSTFKYHMGIGTVVAGRLVEWIKLSPRYLLPLSLFTGFLLFAPQGWLVVVGLVGLADSKAG